jgi:GT2 family glycosyltransferase
VTPEAVGAQRQSDVTVGNGGHSAASVAQLLLESRDIEDCVTLFLGRSPDVEVIRRCLNVELGTVLRELIHSEEFRANVLTPLLLRETLPHERIAQAPSLRLIDWAQRRLPLGPAVRSMAGAARSWTQLLEVLLSDPDLAAVAPRLAAAEIDQVLRERLQNQPLARIKRSVIGAVDSASAVEIRGWALDLCGKDVPVTLEFYADNLFIGAITCGDSRPDVQEAVGGDGLCGFNFRVPAARRAGFAGGRVLFAIDSVSRERIGAVTQVHADLTTGLDILGTTRNEITQLREILQRIEARLPDLGRAASVPLEAYGDYWQRFYRPASDMRASQRSGAAEFGFRPLISIVIPTWNSSSRLLDQAIESVRSQTYDRWELVITDDASAPSDEVQQLLRRHLADTRIRWIEGRQREGIAGNTNRGLAAASGDYIAFLDHDDELAPEAMFEVVRSLQERRYALIYSDEDRIEDDSSGRTVHHTPFFKPGFDQDLLLSMNYICHLVVVRRDVLESAGGLDARFDGAQDHDFLLRVTGELQAIDVRHVPRILYHWRVTPGSVSRTAGLTQAIQNNIVAAVQEHLRRSGFVAIAEAHADPIGAARPFATRVRWQLPPVAPTVSVIIPTRDRLDLLRPCIESVLRSAPSYPGPLELLIVDNDSAEPATAEYFAGLAATPQVRVVRFRGAFNWSAINNLAARDARGEVLIFLNNDTVVLTDDWCLELTANALRRDVGAVGARLLYADGTLQHAGVVLGVEGVAGHDSVGEAPERGGYFGRSHLQRSCAAVTGACLATRRELFEQVGGFDELNLKIAFNDVDYCLRLLEAGYRVVYNPFAVLYHFESKSRGQDLSEVKLARHRAEAATFRSRWRLMVDTDPYYNPHFERFARPFERLRSPP